MYIQRQFFHTRFTFILIIILNTLEMKDHATKPDIIYREYFARDLKYCYKCFDAQVQHCTIFFPQIQLQKEFSGRQLLSSILPNISWKRNNQLLKFKNSKEKLIAKYLFNKKQPLKSNFEIDQLKKEFLLQQENLQGMQYLPLETIDKFVNSLQKFHKNLTKVAIWNYLLNNIQPLIYNILYERNLPVPKIYAVCGFTLYQQYVGKDLYNFFKTDFFTKLRISKQLLEAAIQFSHGFDNYRLYVTDLTADNIVYDKVTNQIYFIDLDTILIVDSKEAKYKSFIHKHFHIECPGCFAYSATDIASYNISDINIYSVCQFLREDLYKEQTKGFLYPIPLDFDSSNSKFRQLLNNCVDCPDNFCLDRFTAAMELINLFEKNLQSIER